MAQRKTLFSVQAISDDSTGIYRIGEIDTLPDEAVWKHVRRHGEFGYEELRDFFVRGLWAAQEAIHSYRNVKNNGVEQATKK